MYVSQCLLPADVVINFLRTQGGFVMNRNDFKGCIFVLQENVFLELQSVGKALQRTNLYMKYTKHTLSGVNSLADTHKLRSKTYRILIGDIDQQNFSWSYQDLAIIVNFLSGTLKILHPQTAGSSLEKTTSIFPKIWGL